MLKPLGNVLMILVCFTLLSACKISSKKEESYLEDSVSKNDYFLPETTKDNISTSIGSANFEFKVTPDNPEVIIKNEDVEHVVIDVKLSGFLEDDLFIYVDDILIERRKNDAKNISIPLSNMVFAVTPGQHVLTISQYESNDEENKLINSISKNYNVVFEKEK